MRSRWMRSCELAQDGELLPQGDQNGGGGCRVRFQRLQQQADTGQGCCRSWEMLVIMSRRALAELFVLGDVAKGQQSLSLTQAQGG